MNRGKTASIWVVIWDSNSVLPRSMDRHVYADRAVSLYLGFKALNSTKFACAETDLPLGVADVSTTGECSSADGYLSV